MTSPDRARLIFKITVAIRSPFLFAGLEASGLGIDSSALRAPGGGDEDGPPPPLLPGDHLRGHLRLALKLMADHAPSSGVDGALIDALLGTPSPEENGEQNRPARGRLFMGDLIGKTRLADGKEVPLEEGLVYSRVKIDDATGSAEKGMLQFIELAAPLGALVLFRGELTAFWPSGKGDELATILEKALRLIPAMGGIKSAGFGEVVAERCEITKTADAPLAAPLSREKHEDRLAFEVEFDRPILINAEHVALNVLRGSDIVPGGAIKGALANAFAAAGEDTKIDSPLDKALARVVIGHAFPLKDGKAANMALPLSLVTATGKGGNIRVRDAARHWQGGAFLIDDRVPLVPAFSGDWKAPEAKAAAEAWGAEKVDVPSLPRGRTAIGPQGVAKDQALFVTVARGVRGLRWGFTIERNGADRDLYGRIVETLKGGIYGLGRTDATMRIVGERTDELSPAEPMKNSDGAEVWPILLTTFAVMTDPANPAPLTEQYEAFFRHRAGNDPGVVLRAHFSSRIIAGRYAAVRRRAYGDAVYRPFELTKAGSLFLLSGLDSEVVEAWRRGGLDAGLPQPDGSLRDLNWTNCPFVSGNGYGAIGVYSRHHLKLGGKVDHV